MLEDALRLAYWEERMFYEKEHTRDDGGNASVLFQHSHAMNVLLTVALAGDVNLDQRIDPVDCSCSDCLAGKTRPARSKEEYNLALKLGMLEIR